ncbi:hypothetical protein L596_020493 [Steinernema carpocapsae]|uniref:Uncharacterized protein n=1 Tax=Steinernema carpocapsae TaxID=34508 RepID=A0A4U5MTQ5_STECR|nr:hypothetical protein L596_020493 [Steinernema carpocapsae]
MVLARLGGGLPVCTQASSKHTLSSLTRATTLTYTLPVVGRLVLLLWLVSKSCSRKPNRLRVSVCVFSPEGTHFNNQHTQPSSGGDDDNEENKKQKEKKMMALGERPFLQMVPQ